MSTTACKVITLLSLAGIGIALVATKSLLGTLQPVGYSQPRTECYADNTCDIISYPMYSGMEAK